MLNIETTTWIVVFHINFSSDIAASEPVFLEKLQLSERVMVDWDK